MPRHAYIRARNDRHACLVQRSNKLQQNVHYHTQRFSWRLGFRYALLVYLDHNSGATFVRAGSNVSIVFMRNIAFTSGFFS
jgi:hypothetical protein